MAPGQTLFRIAVENRPQGVSLDKMLLGLYQANPGAFIDANMNRLKAGAVLKLPGQAQLGGIEDAQARLQIQAQSTDFDAYRRRLAAAAPKASKVPVRRATGQVQAQVRDAREPPTPAPDRLTLSQGTVGTAAESTLSGQTEARAMAERQAELARNLEELRRLQGGPSAPRGGAPGGGLPPASSVDGGLPLAMPAPEPPAPAVPAAPPMDATLLPAPAPLEPPVVPPALPPATAIGADAPPPPPPPDKSTRLADEPYVVPAAIALITVLAGLTLFALLRLRRRSKARAPLAVVDQDPVLEAAPSMVAPAAEPAFDDDASEPVPPEEDLDPVTQAHIHLAHGRVPEAERVLRQGMRDEPQRLDIPAKLLEVFATRQDVDLFNELAQQIHDATEGQADPWPDVAAMGRQLDPGNPLYIDKEGLPDLSGTPDERDPLDLPEGEGYEKDALDLPEGEDYEKDALDLPDGGPFEKEAKDLPEQGAALKSEVELDLPDEFVPTLPDDGTPKPYWGAERGLVNKIAEEEPKPSAAESVEKELERPQREMQLERKLMLAEEFAQIGDAEAARDLLKEVLSSDDPAMKRRAEVLLDDLA